MGKEHCFQELQAGILSSTLALLHFVTSANIPAKSSRTLYFSDTTPLSKSHSRCPGSEGQDFYFNLLSISKARGHSPHSGSKACSVFI